jgi:hypothetical protein
MQPRIRAFLVVGSIAIASALAGAAIDRTLLVRVPHRGARPGPSTPAQDARRRAEMLDRLARDLDLSTAQRAAIDTIFQHTDSTFHAIRRDMQPRMRQLLAQSRADIAARLDSTQRVKFARINAEREKAHGGAR